MITFDSSLLLGYYQSRANVSLAAGAASSRSSSTSKKAEASPPWQQTSADAGALAKRILAGRSVIDPSAAKGANGDETYGQLFTLYSGLNGLSTLLGSVKDKTATESELKRLQSVFDKGLAEVAAYAHEMKLDGMRITSGVSQSSVKTSTGVAKSSSTYVTKAIHTGGADAPVTAFQGPVTFALKVNNLGTVSNFNFDLAEMGSTPRTMANVRDYVNGKLKAAGLSTRFAVERTAGEPQEIKIGDKTVKLAATEDSYAFRIEGSAAEKLTFSASNTSTGIYVTTRGGDPDPDKKSETDDAVYSSTLTKFDGASAVGSGQKVFTDTLQGTIDTVGKSVIGPDGSVYMVATVKKEGGDDKDVNGEVLKGDQDIALLKYDSAGKLIYARTLGAGQEASGYNLAVNTNGDVAVVGSVVGQLSGAVEGVLNSGADSKNSDSVAILFDAKGDELWTTRLGAAGEDEATAVAFGPDGMVYVGGRTKSAMAMAADGAKGGWDSYVTGIATNTTKDVYGVATSTPKITFTQQFGTAENDSVSALVVDGGKLYVGGLENGDATVRQFNVATTVTKKDGQNVYTTAVTKGPVRNLGNLGGGVLAGMALQDGKLWLGGATGKALNVGNVKSPLVGGIDAFGLSISADLSSSAQDAVSYFGGAGDDTVTGMAAANGSVVLVGVASDQLLGDQKVGKQQGYVVSLDVAGGGAPWMQTLSGKDGYATPTSVAVDPTGSGILDKLGLPKGEMMVPPSESLIAGTSLRAGDTFQIRGRAGGNLTTIKIDAKETLDTLADKIRKATQNQAKVSIVTGTDNTRQLKIAATTKRDMVEIVAGKAQRDALESLGLTEGMIYQTEEKNGRNMPTDGKGLVYGLKLDNAYDLSTKEGRKTALDALTAAIATIQRSYRDLSRGLEDVTKKPGKTDGTVPAYLTKQISMYQDALAKLGG